MSFLSKEVKREIKSILIIVLCWSSFNTFFFQISVVPSGSMRPTLAVTDIVAVKKFAYGFRLPRTASLPFLEKTLPWTNIPSYIPLPIPYIRLFSFRQPKIGDVVVFNTPTDRREGWHPHHCQAFVKRVAATWGQTVSIKKGRVWVNGNIEKKFNQVGRKMRYFVETNQRVYNFFKKQGIVDEDIKIVEGGYYLHITADIAAKLQESSVVLSVTEQCEHPIYCEMEEVIVPAKGMKIEINATTLKQYGYAICYLEGHRKAVIENGKLFINGVEVTEYTFRLNYLFVIGDNFFGSWDSRFWGFVPMSHVMGEATIILLGAKDGQEGGEQWYKRIWIIPFLTGKFTWKRSGKRVR